jgi:hypothetical protein
MGKLELLSSYTCPIDVMGLATLSVRVGELAARLGFSVSVWDEDGLGPARGFVCRLPSGRVFGLQELEHEIRYQWAQGPNVLVDAGDLASQGIEPLLGEVLDGLGLCRADVTWLAHPMATEFAAQRVAEVRACHDSKEAPKSQN